VKAEVPMVVTVKLPEEAVELIAALADRVAALEKVVNELVLEREEPTVGVLEAGHQALAARVKAARARGEA
jgi:hypothetical protein